MSANELCKLRFGGDFTHGIRGIECSQAAEIGRHLRYCVRLGHQFLGASRHEQLRLSTGNDTNQDNGLVRNFLLSFQLV
jgi:hypothetical protein